MGKYEGIIGKAIKWYKARQNRTMEAVENRFGISPSEFHNALQENGIESNHSKRKYTSDEKEVIVARYVAGETLEQISNDLGIAKTTIRDWVSAAGESRPCHTPKRKVDFRKLLGMVFAFPSYGKLEVCELGGYLLDEVNQAFGPHLFLEKVAGAHMVARPFSKTTRFTLEVRQAMGKMYEAGASYTAVAKAYNTCVPNAVRCVASVGVKSRSSAPSHKMRCENNQAKTVETLPVKETKVQNRRLTESQRLQVVGLYAVCKMSAPELSKEFGISPMSILRLVRTRLGEDAVRSASEARNLVLSKRNPVITAALKAKIMSLCADEQMAG